MRLYISAVLNLRKQKTSTDFAYELELMMQKVDFNNIYSFEIDLNIT